MTMESSCIMVKTGQIDQGVYIYNYYSKLNLVVGPLQNIGECGSIWYLHTYV